jgi:Zn-dependent metalloprotease
VTEPAFNKIKEDVAYATGFLNSLFGMNLAVPAVKPLSDKDRNAYWYRDTVNAPPSAQYLSDMTYSTTAYLFIEKVLGNMRYTAEAGAIDISYGDIYGSLIKQHKLGQTAEQADWLVSPGAIAWMKGENVATSSDKRGLRSLKKPGTAYDDPVLGKDIQVTHVRDLKPGDEPGGGAYKYSGIPSNAFYETAIKIGSPKAGVIWTEALKDPSLPKAMTFKHLAQITYDVAVKLHGNNSAESRAVKDAWNVVGIVVGQ